MSRVSIAGEVGTATHLAHTSSLISRKAATYAIRGWRDEGQTVPILLFGIGAHAGDGDDLLVFLDALLQLPEENTEACARQRGWRGGQVEGNVPPA